MLTLDTVAACLLISRSSAYKLAQQGRIPGQTAGRHWRFYKDAIVEWLERYPDHGTRKGRKR
jgi:excisionase family DNA binding protein